MWKYFYFSRCPACQLDEGFMMSISGIYGIEFQDVESDGWQQAYSCGVTRVPSLFNGSSVIDISLLPEDRIIELLTT